MCARGRKWEPICVGFGARLEAGALRAGAGQAGTSARPGNWHAARSAIASRRMLFGPFAAISRVGSCRYNAAYVLGERIGSRGGPRANTRGQVEVVRLRKLRGGRMGLQPLQVHFCNFCRKRRFLVGLLGCLPAFSPGRLHAHVTIRTVAHWQKLTSDPPSPPSPSRHALPLDRTQRPLTTPPVLSHPFPLARNAHDQHPLLPPPHRPIYESRQELHAHLARLYRSCLRTHAGLHDLWTDGPSVRLCGRGLCEQGPVRRV